MTLLWKIGAGAAIGALVGFVVVPLARRAMTKSDPGTPPPPNTKVPASGSFSIDDTMYTDTHGRTWKRPATAEPGPGKTYWEWSNDHEKSTMTVPATDRVTIAKYLNDAF